MSNNLVITTFEFQSICRTCLSQQNLNPLFEKFTDLTNLAEMLMCCTSIKVSEDDGLPVKICTNCIHEINQAFVFAKRCESTDTFLRKCVKIKTELATNSSHSPKIEVKEEIVLEIKPQIILPNIHQTVDEVLREYECVEEFKQEELKIEIKPILSNIRQTVKEVLVIKQEQEVKIECEESVEIKQEDDVHIIDNKFDSPAIESYKEDDYETYSEKPAIPDRRDSQSLKKGDSSFPIKRRNRNLRQMKSKPSYYDENDADDDQGKTYSATSGSRRKDFLGTNKVHTGIRPYDCHVCGETFSKLHTLKRHKQIHTGENPNVCSICSKVFAFRYNLQIHVSTHTGEKPYSCDICIKVFAHVSDLKNHMSTHNSKKPYSCDVCCKGFARRFNLKLHMRTHTGEKPYSCEICSKAFAYTTDLKNHMSIHNGIKPYSCDVCSKGFARNSHLKIHMRTHTREKPYHCEDCNKTFSGITQVKRHMRTHWRKALQL